MYSQLTVDSDACALFFKDGTYQGYLNPGRHTLQSQNIPFLNNLVTSFTGGDVFIAEIYFVKMQPVRGLPFGGPLESMEDPLLGEFVTPRIFGEFSLQVTDPVKFVVGYHGQAAGAQDNDVILSWIKGKFFMSVKTVIGQVCSQQQKSLLNLGGMTQDLAAAIVQRPTATRSASRSSSSETSTSTSAPTISSSSSATRTGARGGQARRPGIAADTAKAKQFELDQKFGQDARYVQQLAGNWQNYAAGSAMMGAGQGMAQGGGDSGVAGLGADGRRHGHSGMMHRAPRRRATVLTAGCAARRAGRVAHGRGGQGPVPEVQRSGPRRQVLSRGGGALAAPAKKFCSGCGTDMAGAKFCANCGTPAGP